MSVRAIGEGHCSSIGFRTGTFTGSGDVEFDPIRPLQSTGRREMSILEAERFRESFVGSTVAGTMPTTSWATSDRGSPRRRWRHVSDSSRTTVPLGSRQSRTIGLMRRIAERSYSVRFDEGTPLSEQVLLPAMSAESKGMEDARFVRFVEDDGNTTYFASYTAYNGTDIGQQLLETTGLLELHLLAHGGSGGRQQGTCSLSSPDRRSFRCTVSE